MNTIVVLPAYNAAATLQRTLDEIPYEAVARVLLVDDASTDDTYEIARALSADRPLRVERLAFNQGYGANQKRCYDLARAEGADIIVMLHPDYQYDPAAIPQLIAPIITGTHDVMLGTRIRSWREARAGGMPLYKYVGNRFLSRMQNLATGLALSEWHTGMRAYRTTCLAEIPYHQYSNRFVFDSQILFGFLEQGRRLGETPVPVRYFPEASSIGLTGSIWYGLGTLWATARYGVRKALI